MIPVLLCREYLLNEEGTLYIWYAWDTGADAWRRLTGADAAAARSVFECLPALLHPPAGIPAPPRQPGTAPSRLYLAITVAPSREIA